MSFFYSAKQFTKKTVKNLILIFTGVILGALLITAAGLYYFREPLIRATVIPRIAKVTGFPIEVERLRHDFPLRLTLENVTMYNPKGYKPKVFAAAPYFYIDIDLPSLLEGKVFYIREWRILMTALNLDRNKEGIINGMLLKAIKNFMSGKAPGEPGGGFNTTSSMDFKMDRLDLKIHKIAFRDHTGVVPGKNVKKLKLSAHAYNDVTNFGALIDQIEIDVKKEIQITKRVELSSFYLEESLQKAASTVKDTTEKIAEGAGKVVKTTTVKAPAEILKTTAGIIGIKSDDKNSKKTAPATSALPADRVVLISDPSEQAEESNARELAAEAKSQGAPSV